MLFGLRSEGASIRLGVSSSGKAGSNVVRNRLKRILREAARREAGVLGPGYDGHGLEDIASDVRLLFGRLRSRYVDQGGAGAAC
jgi:hypothetical protein